MAEQVRYAERKSPVRINSFAQYKARAFVETVGYDTSSEKAPYHPWFALDHDKIGSNIHQACSSFLDLTGTRTIGDTEMDNLHAALKQAKSLTHGKTLCVAILGEQGIGKSSLICSLFNRDMVHVSSSSSACTAFPTVIAYKEGARDDSTENDVLIQYLSDAEIEDCVREQGRRYRYAFPRKRQSWADRIRIRALSFLDENEFSEEEDDEDEEDDEEEEEETETEKEQTLNSARTARDFFRIIFNTEQYLQRQQQLEHHLEFDDIEGTAFAAKCLDFAKKRLASIGAHDCLTQHNAIHDEDLAEVRREAEKLWPLVKSVRLETGHVLLRNNLCFLDLPGYGDDNQMRTALVENCRDLADFEIVVVPAQRIVTSVTHNNYLTRSIRRLGEGKTLLLANKSDQLLNDLLKHVNSIEDAPFPEAKRCLKQSEALWKAGAENKQHLKEYRSYVLKAAGFAYIEREERIIEQKLGDKGIEVVTLLGSARQYSLCLEASYGDETPIISAEATGIPRLRQFLLGLPARMNYDTLQYHVYETLPDIYGQMQRILNKFDDDAYYADMRKDLSSMLPTTEDSLRRLLELLVLEYVVKPWNKDKTAATILCNLKGLACSLVHPTPYYATFLKIIKENGKPVNGKAKGRNFNNEILGTMENFIGIWYNQLTGKIAVLAADLEGPVQIILRNLRNHLDNLAERPELRRKANYALETSWRRIGLAQDKLRENLEATLRATYLDRTTETHIKSPIALAMAPTYHSVLDVKGGPGAYRRHQHHLYKCLCDPGAPMTSFPEFIAADITETHRESWMQCGREYISEVMALLYGFRDITDELLDSQGYVKAEHLECRDKLRTMLPTFELSLHEVQKSCPRLEGADDRASNKRKRGEE